MTQQPYYITISVVNGDPNGLRVVEHSSWYGKALIFPRTLLPSIVAQREAFGRSAVYFLLGPREDGSGEMLYIGEADPVGDRLQNHYTHKDFWNRAIIFTGSGDQLNKTHVKFLESELVRQAQRAKRVPLENKTSPSTPSMSEPERIRGQAFLNHVLEVLPLLGVHAFEQTPEAVIDTPAVLIAPGYEQSVKFYIRSPFGEAEAVDSSSGFVVLKGSKARLEPTPSMVNHVHGYFELRQQLLNLGVLAASEESLIFAQDYAFESPSAAAAIVLGRSANGRIEWKASDQMTLKANQQALADSLSRGGA